MSMAAARPDLVAGAVLDDIGSTIETAGLLRIKAYVGKATPPRGLGRGGGPVARAARRRLPGLFRSRLADSGPADPSPMSATSRSSTMIRC